MFEEGVCAFLEIVASTVLNSDILHCNGKPYLSSCILAHASTVFKSLRVFGCHFCNVAYVAHLFYSEKYKLDKDTLTIYPDITKILRPSPQFPFQNYPERNFYMYSDLRS